MDGRSSNSGKSCLRTGNSIWSHRAFGCVGWIYSTERRKQALVEKRQQEGGWAVVDNGKEAVRQNRWHREPCVQVSNPWHSRRRKAQRWHYGHRRRWYFENRWNLQIWCVTESHCYGESTLLYTSALQCSSVHIHMIAQPGAGWVLSGSSLRDNRCCQYPKSTDGTGSDIDHSQRCVNVVEWWDLLQWPWRS
jgi:hypothetical protein